MKSRIVIYLSTLLLAASCVSVKLDTGSELRKKSTDYSFDRPRGNYSETDAKDSDHSWISKSTANSISIFTSCSEQEPPLRNIRANTLQGLESIDVKDEALFMINAREGLKSTVEGKIEGVPVLIEMIIFKKNSCSYQLSYVALAKNFQTEKSTFDNFVKSFRVN